MIDAFRAVVGDADGDVYRINDEQVWISGRGVDCDQRQRLRYEGWLTICNNEQEGIVYGFGRYGVLNHMLSPEGRRTVLPEPVNTGSTREQFARALTETLPIWQIDGNSVYAMGDQVQRLDFNGRNVTFPHQCSVLVNAGWRESITPNWTGQCTHRYFVPAVQYMSATIWEALTYYGTTKTNALLTGTLSADRNTSTRRRSAWRSPLPKKPHSTRASLYCKGMTRLLTSSGLTRAIGQKRPATSSGAGNGFSVNVKHITAHEAVNVQQRLPLIKNLSDLKVIYWCRRKM